MSGKRGLIEGKVIFAIECTTDSMIEGNRGRSRNQLESNDSIREDMYTCTVSTENTD